MSPWLTAVIAALAAAMAVPPAPGAGAGAGAWPGRRARHRAGSSPAAGPPRRSRLVAVISVSGAVALLVGGSVGVVAGLCCGALTWVVTGRLEPARDRARGVALVRQAPLVLDLVSACLASGSTVESALSATSRAVGSPAAGILDDAVSALRLGAEPRVVWAEVEGHEPLAGLARALARSSESGAGLRDLLAREATRARDRYRADAQASIRTVGVRLTAPLGLAFLPAFLLLGVVPVVASWAGALL